jgi:hypothetical protein
MAEDVLWLLAALTADVDDGLAELLAAPMRMPLRSAATGEIPSLADAARRRTARAVTGALIVAGLVSVSGVSAAVTGDPFTPYRSIISSVGGEDEPRSQPPVVEDEVVRQQVLAIDAAIEAGELGRAREGIERLRASLDKSSHAAQRSVLARLEVLEARLSRAVENEERVAQRTRALRPHQVVDPGSTKGAVAARGHVGTGKSTGADRERARDRENQGQNNPGPQAPPRKDDKAPVAGAPVAEPADDTKPADDAKSGGNAAAKR